MQFLLAPACQAQTWEVSVGLLLLLILQRIVGMLDTSGQHLHITPRQPILGTKF